MSVKILKDRKAAECPLIQKIGGYCFCRANNLSSYKQLKDQIATRHENVKVVIDLAKYPRLKKTAVTRKHQLSQQPPEGQEHHGTDGFLSQGEGEVGKGADVDAGGDQNLCKKQYIEYSVDFGVVPVEASVFREFYVIDSRHPKIVKKIDIRENKDGTDRDSKSSNEKIDSVFRTVLPSSRLQSDLFSLALSGKNGVDVDTIIGAGGDCGGAGDSNNIVHVGPHFVPAIRPDSMSKFRVIFEPDLPAMHYSEIFFVSVDDNVEIVLKCSGFSEGPSICFSENVLNFGAHYLDDESRLKFALHNHSDCPGQFQFDNDNERSVFKICPLQGIIEAKSYQVVEVTFQGYKASMFYKRVNCYIHHQQPQYLEMLGMCIARPFFLVSPIDFCLSSDQTQFLPFPTEFNTELFECERFWGIHLSKETIDFGFHDAQLTPNEASVLRITNTLPHDVLIEWVPDPTGIFVITPLNGIIRSRQSALFEVYFDPAFPETFYNGQLECYIYPTERVWPEQMNPPWIHFPKEYVYEEPASAMTAAIEYQEIGTDKNENSDEIHDEGDFITASSMHIGDDDQESVKHSKSRTSAPGVKKKKRKIRKSGILHELKVGEIESVIVDGHEQGPAKVPSIEQFKKELEDVVAKLNETIPKKPTSPVFVDGAQQYPLTLSLRHTGCSQTKTYSLEPQVNVPMPRHLVYMSTASRPSTGQLPPERTDLAASVQSKPVSDGMSESAVSLRDSTFKGDTEISEQVSTVSVTTAKEEGPSEIAIPLCLVVKVIGHSFKTHCPVPQFFVPKNITLPPAWPKSRTFRTFILRNHTDMPIHFDGLIDDDDRVCQIRPSKGVIPGNFHQIILIASTPRREDLRDYLYNCNMIFNLKDTDKIAVHGRTELPKLDLILYHKSVFNEIVFQETHPGCHSETSFELRNSSRFHYKFSFLPLDQQNSSVFVPTPANGLISPYETIKISWRFCPREEGSYFVKWGVYINVLRTRYEKKPDTTYYKELTLVGTGTIAKIYAKPRELNFGMVEIYKEKEMPFTLKNRSNASVVVMLRVMHEDMLQQFLPPDQAQIDCSQFYLKANQSKTINVKVKPNRTNFQLFYIEYTIQLSDIAKRPSTRESRAPIANEFKKICNISFIGDHSVFKVTDIIHYTRHPIWDFEYCWTMFTLEKLNHCLLPSNVAKKGTVPFTQSVAFNFPPGPINSEPAVFSIMLANQEQLKGFWEIQMLPPKQWSKYLRRSKTSKITKISMAEAMSHIGKDGESKSDKKLVNLIWSRKIFGKSFAQAETTESRKSGTRKSTRINRLMTAYALKLDDEIDVDILENMCHFKVTPVRGWLEPGQTQAISFSYKYDKVGQHKASALLRIHPGIFIWLDLNGTTLGDNDSHVHLMHAKEFQLHPVSLADLDPPVQMLWVYNAGNVSCPFQIDEDPFEEAAKENYGHEVFQCLTIEGIIPAKSMAPIKIRFSPIEIKEYQFYFNILANNEFIKVKTRGSALINPTIHLRPVMQMQYRRKYRLTDPIVPMTLSPTQIIYDKFIPTGQKSNSTIFLTNLSRTNKISFSWAEIELDGDGSISFVPQNGLANPGEQVEITVTVTGGSVSTVFSRIVRCFMLDETAMARYDLAYKAWEASRSRLLALMKEDDAEKRLQKEMGDKPEKPPSFSKVVTVQAYIGTVFGLLDTAMEKEQMAMPSYDTVLPVPQLKKPNGDGELKLGFPPFARQLCREIISAMLWDIINSSSFPSYINQISNGRVPFYNDYKQEEIRKKRKIKIPMEIPTITFNQLARPTDDHHCSNKKVIELSPNPANFLRLTRQTNEDVLEEVICNLIQDVATAFKSSRQKKKPVKI